MSNTKGTQTENNLYSGFAGESQAFMKYTLYAEQAKKEGYIKAEKIFKQIAENEKAHAEIWLKNIHNGNLPNTECNLKDAANGEHFEWSEMYSGYGKKAEEEGIQDLAKVFHGVAHIEQGHDNMFKELLTEIQNGNILKSQQEETWECQNCGHHHVGIQPPGVCPVCEKQEGYFKKLENS